MVQDSSFTIRRADGPADMNAIYEFLRARETLRAKMVEPKAKTGIAATIREGLAFIIERNGAMIGTAGLFRAPWWYSDESAFFSKWFHIAEEARDTRVVEAVIEEFYDLAEAEQEPVFIHVLKGGDVSKFSARAAQEYALFPSGRIAAIHPKAEG